MRLVKQQAKLLEHLVFAAFHILYQESVSVQIKTGVYCTVILHIIV